MNSAQEYAKAAAQLTKFANAVKPPAGAEYREARELATYHLKSAASKLRQVAEHLAAKESMLP